MNQSKSEGFLRNPILFAAALCTLNACDRAGAAVANIRLEESRWDLVRIGEERLSLDTAKVGTFPLQERLVISLNPPRAVVSGQYLSRDMHNNRSISIDSADGTVMGSSDCAAFVFRGSKEEVRLRYFVDSSIHSYIRDIPITPGRDLSLGRGPLQFDIVGDTLRLYGSDCWHSQERVYVRVKQQ